MNRKDHPSEVIKSAPLAPRFGAGFLTYQDFGEFEVTLYSPGGVQLFSVEVSEDGSSVFASTGGGSRFLDLNLPASQAAAKMLEVATRILHEPHFEMSKDV